MATQTVVNQNGLKTGSLSLAAAALAAARKVLKDST